MQFSLMKNKIFFTSKLQTVLSLIGTVGHFLSKRYSQFQTMFNALYIRLNVPQIYIIMSSKIPLKNPCLTSHN